MEVKRDILWRVYLSYILVIGVCIAIFGKAVYIQQVQGAHWRSMSDSLHQRIDSIEAERGTIYSEDGQMLSTSIPQFDLFIDFRVEWLHEKSGIHFRENLDSLSFYLSNLFKDRSVDGYKQWLTEAYKDNEPYLELHKKTSYREYEQLRKFPLFRDGRYKSGLIVNERNIRLNPYGILAFRTIGLDRESSKVGLEKTYDSLLKGREGKQWVRTIAGGVKVPINDDYIIEPETGKDIVSTIDVFIQEIAENALMKMMEKNEAEHGCAIVMEVKTGKIKAIANLGKKPSGGYWEDYNYAISTTEPGSTFKLATMMALLEDKKINLNTMVDLEGGVWRVAGQTVYDSEQSGHRGVTAKQAFELSSNVGMAKLVSAYYSGQPSQFINRLKQMQMDTLTGIDLVGEGRSTIYKPGQKMWGPTTMPWMAFGYNLQISPLQTLALYNAVANQGKMMRPYLVSSVREEGVLLKNMDPIVVREKVCSDQTLAQLRECLEGVCIAGTAKELFKNSLFPVAGKTGTALVANGNKGYADKIYQSSFAGYFPADNPQYTCVVVVKNKPHAAVFYGASVAGPVFKEIADRLYSTYVKGGKNELNKKLLDSSLMSYAGSRKDMARVMGKLKLGFRDSASNATYVAVKGEARDLVVTAKSTPLNLMPELNGMGLKDAVYVCENMGLKLNIRGKGKVMAQSITAGLPVVKGQLVEVELNK
ncbi:MAG: peptidoglycan glycosyltransferase [Chitinophagaceae bacterium BSSC1]|nr:MAG: peptidoglycan glycosyltransferase [Chitinophagaceae bacterium BSSC1]